MSSYDPWSLNYRRPERPVKTLAFPHPEGGEWSLTLRGLDMPGMSAAGELADELANEMLGTPGEAGIGFAAPDGQPLELTRRLLGNVAMLMRMEVPADGVPAHDETWWLGISVMAPAVWRRCLKAAAELNPGEEADPKN